jgi:hypothetical protein
VYFKENQRGYLPCEEGNGHRRFKAPGRRWWRRAYQPNHRANPERQQERRDQHDPAPPLADHFVDEFFAFFFFFVPRLSVAFASAACVAAGMAAVEKVDATCHGQEGALVTVIMFCCRNGG